MQYAATMAVEHALGIAGGAGSVAKAGGGILVELRPFEAVGLSRHQLFISRQAIDSCALRLGRITEIDPALNSRTLRHQLLHQVDEGGIEEDEAILGVIDDVDDLIDEQAGVHGVTNTAHARNPIIKLKMAVPLPPPRRHGH